MPRKKKVEYPNPDFMGWKGEPHDGTSTDSRFNSRYWRDMTPGWLAGECHERDRGPLGIPGYSHWLCSPIGDGRFSIGFQEDDPDYDYTVWEFTPEELERREGGRVVYGVAA